MKSIYWAVLIENSIIMICWTALAIYFGRWWIALFAALCFSNLKWKSDKAENSAIDSPLDKP